MRPVGEVAVGACVVLVTILDLFGQKNLCSQRLATHNIREEVFQKFPDSGGEMGK